MQNASQRKVEILFDLEEFVSFVGVRILGQGPSPVTIKMLWAGVWVKTTLHLLFNMADKAAVGHEQWKQTKCEVKKHPKLHHI